MQSLFYSSNVKIDAICSSDRTKEFKRKCSQKLGKMYVIFFKALIDKRKTNLSLKDQKIISRAEIFLYSLYIIILLKLL
jgi:hypothetical protein